MEIITDVRMLYVNTIFDQTKNFNYKNCGLKQR